MSTMIEVNREQFAAAVEQVWRALVDARGQGATIAALCEATGLPERRCQRAVNRLIGEGRARRDGERGKVYALADDNGQAFDIDDRRNRELAARRAKREFAGRKGWVAGELVDAMALLDGRTVPAGFGGQAEGAREYLKQARRDVDAMPDLDALEALIAETRPAIEAINRLLAAIEGTKRHAAEGRAAVHSRLAELKDQRGQLAGALAKIRNAQDRIACIPSWQAWRAWEAVRHVAVLGRPLFTAGTWEPSRGGFAGLLSAAGRVTVTCSLTGAAAAFPATNRDGVEVQPDVRVLVGMLGDAEAVLAAEVRAIDAERAELAEGVRAISASAYQAELAAAPLLALPAAQQRGPVRDRPPRRELCAWCNANPAPAGLPCPACAAGVLSAAAAG